MRLKFIMWMLHIVGHTELKEQSERIKELEAENIEAKDKAKFYEEMAERSSGSWHHIKRENYLVPRRNLNKDDLSSLEHWLNGIPADPRGDYMAKLMEDRRYET